MMEKIDRIADYVFKKDNVPKEEAEILLTSEEAADLLKISTRTLQRMRKDKTIPYMMVRSKCRYRLTDLEECVRRKIVHCNPKTLEEFKHNYLMTRKEAEKELMRRMWAGNVRELKQTVRSAVLLTEGRLIGADRLEAESMAQAGSSLLLKDGNEERERIVRALAQADGNREVTAGLLGISRTTLYNKMKEYGIMQKKSEK